MAPVGKHRGGQRQPDLALEKFISSLDGVPDEVTLGRLQSILETLLSERSHPMMVGLRKQVDQLKHAENIIQREIESRKEKDAPIDKKDVKKEDTDARDPASEDINEEMEGVQEESVSSTNTDDNIKREDGDTQSKKRKLNQTDEGGSTGGKSNEPPNGGDSEVKIPHNKKFVANPKSEYVSNQPLPYHALGIFNEDEADADEEAYKRRLGVVSYPKEDLSTLTAGPVPMDDYTRSKPPNQVQFSTYATFLEPYFRQFTDEDIQFLQQPAVGAGVEAANLRGGKRLSPFAFPPLGPHYQQQWAAQDAELSGVELPDSARKARAARAASLSQVYLPRGGVSDLNDQNLQSLTSSASLGPFTERLVAAIMPEYHDTPQSNTPSATVAGTPSAENDEDSGGAGAGGEGPDTPGGGAGAPSVPPPPPPEKAVSTIPGTASAQMIDDFGQLEERVKGEFRYVGVLDVSMIRKFENSKSEFKLAVPPNRDEFADPSAVNLDWTNGSEDDEISRELRFLQRKLGEVYRRNAVYKQRLIPIVKEQLAWQEYQSILQDLDKQVDQAYQKRLKQPKVSQPKQQKKRNESVASFESPNDSASPAAPGGAHTPTVDGSVIPDQKPAIKALMDKRERWIQKIGPLFRPAYQMMREYETPKFQEVDEDDAANSAAANGEDDDGDD